MPTNTPDFPENPDDNPEFTSHFSGNPLASMVGLDDDIKEAEYAAWKYAKEKGEARDDTAADAIRHMAFTAAIDREYGDLGVMAMQAREWLGNLVSKDKRQGNMDTHNNAMGVDVFREIPEDIRDTMTTREIAEVMRGVVDAEYQARQENGGKPTGQGPKFYETAIAKQSYAEGGIPMPCGDPMSLMFPDTFEVSVGTDPVSGNDIPPGSSPENVRDDIPAVISSGEYVVPADVVRYHGLKTFMAMRDEAKMGLMMMQAEGQIKMIDEELEEEYEEDLEEDTSHETAEGNEIEAAEHEVEEEMMDVEEEEDDEDLYPSEPGQFAYKPSVRFAVISK